MEIYHVLNRGIEKRSVVKNDDDRARFVQSLFVFNDRRPAINSVQLDRGTDATQRKARAREKLVDIHAWCLMDNHYHLLLSSTDGTLQNISLFMKKLNMGYAKFFNEKYKRTGYLWQGKYKRIHVASDAHFLYIPHYIHLNPLDYSHPNWRLGKVTGTQHALNRLQKYRWSSYLDYIGERNFPSIINREFFGKILGPKSKQERTAASIMSDLQQADASKIIE